MRAGSSDQSEGPARRNEKQETDMPRSAIKITTSPVSDAYSGRDEKRIEFSALRVDVLEDGSYNSLMGGLISFTVIRANGGDVPEDKLIVNVYRTDPNVEVRWQQDDRITVTEAQLAQVIRNTPLGHGLGGSPDQEEIPGISARLAGTLFRMLAELPREPEPRAPVGDAARLGYPALTDPAALEGIQEMLRDPEWGVGMLEDIAELVQATGRTTEDYDDGRSTWPRH
jgi:hypothetical protein